MFIWKTLVWRCVKYIGMCLQNIRHSIHIHSNWYTNIWDLSCFIANLENQTTNNINSYYWSLHMYYIFLQTHVINHILVNVILKIFKNTQEQECIKKSSYINLHLIMNDNQSKGWICLSFIFLHINLMSSQSIPSMKIYY